VSADTGQLRAIEAKNDQLLSEMGRLRGSIGDLVEVLEKLVEAAVTSGRDQHGTLLQLVPRDKR
jgi:hypothetical protein